MNQQRQGRVFDPGSLDCGAPTVLARTSSSNRTEPPSEEDPLQNPRPPEYNGAHVYKVGGSSVSHRQPDQTFAYRAKRWSARLSSRASVLWGGGDVPPPVPRHRDTSKYNQNSSDTNHIRLFERKTRAYSCRELLCIVFLPCLLICLLGIALSSLVIYYQIGKEYETEIEILEKELALAREKDGVYLSSHKYRELLNLANNNKLDEVQRMNTIDEMSSSLERKEREVEELNQKIESLRDTLDCTYTVVQTGRHSVREQLEEKCKLSHRAQLLLAVSDQAVESLPPSNSFKEDVLKLGHQRSYKAVESEGKASASGHHHKGEGKDGQHWLLGSKRSSKSDSAEFQQFLVTELTRMEQNIIDFSSQHETYCSEFRLSLEAELERRNQDLSVLANRLTGLIDGQSKAIGKLETLATDQMYAEQKWVTSYLKNIRNEADRQTTSLQGFLTESFLPSIRLMNTGVLEVSSQVSSLQGTFTKSLQTGTNKLFAFLDSQKKLILSTKDSVLNLSRQQNKDIQVLRDRQEEVMAAENQFQNRFREAQRKIDSLLTSVMAEYQQFSKVLNSTSSRSSSTLDSLSTRSKKIDSSLNIAVSEIVSGGDTLKTRSAQQKIKLDSEVSGMFEQTQAATKTLRNELKKVEVQGKQMVGERQGAWELHYSNSEIMLRKKADKNKELLQKHQVQSQETHSSLLQFSNGLEEMAERKRQTDTTHTAERQADLQAACKNVAGFTHLLTSELHARDSDLANYFTNRDRN